MTTMIADAAVSSVSSPMNKEEAAITVKDNLEESGFTGNVEFKPAWMKPSNAITEGASVMGADLWPALSDEWPRVSLKPNSDSAKSLCDGSSFVSASQGAGTVSPFSHKQVSSITESNFAANNKTPAQQRQLKHNYVQPQGSQSHVGESLPNNPSHRDYSQRNSQSLTGNDQTQQQRNSFRSRNNGSYHHNYGGRRDQDRNNQGWNYHHNLNGRNGHIQPGRRFYRNHPPPPPVPMSFMPPPAMRPFPSPVFSEVGSNFYYVPPPPPESFRSIPPVPGPTPPRPVFYPPLDVELPTKIMKQIDYYFSTENLIRDTYLRLNMDDQGWVPIKLIASFNRVAQLTDNIQLVLDALRNSSIVEIEGDKVRRQNDWMKWILPTSMQFPDVSSPRPLGNSNQDMLSASIEQLSLGDDTNPGTGRIQSDDNAEVSVGNSSNQIELPRNGRMNQSDYAAKCQSVACEKFKQ